MAHSHEQPPEVHLDEHIVFDTLVEIAYFKNEHYYRHASIQSEDSLKRTHIRALEDIAVRGSQKATRAKLGGKSLAAKSVAVRFRDVWSLDDMAHDATAVQNHYEYLASFLLLKEDELDYRALDATLTGEFGFDEDLIAEARRNFDMFLLTEL